jgi:hypothetical protein
MSWFRKATRKEIWEVDGPIGDIASAHTIRDICKSAAKSAESAARLFYGPSTTQKKQSVEQYGRAKQRALDIARKIHDELLRDSAVHEILRLCMKANDVESAELLAHEIRAKMISEMVLQEYPFFAIPQRKKGS